MEVQAPHCGDDVRENRAALTSPRLAEGREHLERMQVKSMGDFHKNQRDLQSLMELCKWMEEQQVAWSLERERMESEVCNLKSELEQFRAVSTSPRVCDIDSGSEEIDVKALAERKWISSGRQALAPITPEAVRARTPSVKVGVGKENIYCDQRIADEIQGLRREVEHWKQKMNRLAKEHRGLRNQYKFLQKLLGSKGDVGHLVPSPDHVEVALEGNLEESSKVRKRSPVATPTEGGDFRSPNPTFSDLNGPSTPVILPRAAAEVGSEFTASTSSYRDLVAKIKVEPESLKESTHVPPSKNKTAGGLDSVFDGKLDQAVDLFEIPSTKNKSAGRLEAVLESNERQAADNSGTHSAVTGNRKRPLEPSGKPPFKFVEPLRKKAERENLQGAECKLCKKFYDAVIAGNAQGMAESRCNHLEKSRHRFRDLPPATPEGFWNIGFDSEF